MEVTFVIAQSQVQQQGLQVFFIFKLRRPIL